MWPSFFDEIQNFQVWKQRRVLYWCRCHSNWSSAQFLWPLDLKTFAVLRSSTFFVTHSTMWAVFVMSTSRFDFGDVTTIVETHVVCLTWWWNSRFLMKSSIVTRLQMCCRLVTFVLYRWIGGSVTPQYFVVPVDFVLMEVDFVRIFFLTQNPCA